VSSSKGFERALLRVVAAFCHLTAVVYSALRKRRRFDNQSCGLRRQERVCHRFLTRDQYPGAQAGKKERSGAMAERSQNLQDLFLNTVRKQKISLTIFLINGVKLTGVVTSFDNFCVLLRRDGHSQLVYKHAISTIMPGQPMQMFESEESAA
jgi:host factor-I protein